MSLSTLSISSIAMLLATVGLSSSSLVPMQATKAKQSIRISGSHTEIVSRDGSSIRITNRQSDRPFRQSRVLRSASVAANRATQSHMLAVETTGRSLNATLKVNGRTVKSLTRLSETINMTPHLSSGQNTIEISGSYSPASASTRLSLSGPGTQMTQQVSGGGRLNQTLSISVP